MEGILNNHRENRLKTGLKEKIEKEKASCCGRVDARKKSSLLIGLLRLKGETGGLDWGINQGKMRVKRRY